MILIIFLIFEKNGLIKVNNIKLTKSWVHKIYIMKFMKIKL